MNDFIVLEGRHLASGRGILHFRELEFSGQTGLIELHGLAASTIE